ncbi:S-adenosylmethionine transporter [Gymnopilus junonius]|uniref:S-adenosylmethionine transporter n=1 Tax=Gymnopilus junonius TaxID=109634 RepID=A0A9P5NDI3_GYMJU|nr:S-adenosylmethionine transporter [Gymnopilus junonius]
MVDKESAMLVEIERWSIDKNSRGVAGTSVDLLFFPIDTIKTRLQSSQGFRAAGGLSGVYKGIGSVVVGSAPGERLSFLTYDTMKKTLPLQENLAPLKHMISASVGEVAACLVRVPTEVIKTRMQTSTYGFGITVMREIPFTSLQFPLYEFLKLQLSRRINRKPLYAHEAAVCGSIAGGVAAALTTPLDVLKTRVMLDLRDPSKEKLPSLLSRFRAIYTAEGPRALFAGVVPRTLWISAGAQCSWRV